MSKNITVIKLKLTVLGESKEETIEKYKFIRDSQYAQYQGLNIAMSYLVSSYYANGRDLKNENYIRDLKALTNSNPIFEGINFGKGIDSKSAITQRVKKDFKTAMKNGFARGERSVNNYKRTYPLITRGRDLKFNYNDDNDIIIKWVNGISFKVVIGRKDKDYEHNMHFLNMIINKECKVMQSSFMFNNKNKLILNTTVEFEGNINKEPIEGRVLGVDLGIKYPAYICLSDNTYIRTYLGNSLELLKWRTQFKERRRRRYRQLKNVKGGKGRDKKMANIKSLSGKERRFVNTYNHVISKRIIDFAKKNRCESINIEALTKDGFTDSVLSNWSYYELQEMIKYKAEREGITVRAVNPAYTSQTCSACGNVDKENRPSQEEFCCTKCGFKTNADHNAAINIARSTDFVK